MPASPLSSSLDNEDLWYNIPPVLHHCIKEMQMNIDAHRRVLNEIRHEIQEENEVLRRVVERSTDMEVEMRTKHTFIDEYWKKRVGDLELRVKDISATHHHLEATALHVVNKKVETLIEPLRNALTRSTAATDELRGTVETQDKSLHALELENATVTATIRRMETLTMPFLSSVEADVRTLQEELKTVTMSSLQKETELRDLIQGTSTENQKFHDEMSQLCIQRWGKIEMELKRLNTEQIQEAKGNEGEIGACPSALDSQGKEKKTENLEGQLHAVSEQLRDSEIRHSEREKFLQEQVDVLKRELHVLSAATPRQQAESSTGIALHSASQQVEQLQAKAKELSNELEKLTCSCRERYHRMKKRWKKFRVTLQQRVSAAKKKREAASHAGDSSALQEDEGNNRKKELETMTTEVKSPLHGLPLRGQVSIGAETVTSEKWDNLAGKKNNPHTAMMMDKPDSQADLRIALIDVEAMKRRLSALECRSVRCQLVCDTFAEYTRKVDVLELRDKESCPNHPTHALSLSLLSTHCDDSNPSQTAKTEEKMKKCGCQCEVSLEQLGKRLDEVEWRVQQKPGKRQQELLSEPDAAVTGAPQCSTGGAGCLNFLDEQDEEDKEEAEAAALAQRMRKFFYLKTQMEERLENMWVSFVALLARKADKTEKSD